MTDEGSEDWLRRGEGGVFSVSEALVYLPLLREATCAGGLQQPKTLSQVLRAKYTHSEGTRWPHMGGFRLEALGWKMERSGYRPTPRKT